MKLESILAPVESGMKAVDAELRVLMGEAAAQTLAARGKAGIIDRIIQHPFAVPGKRIRPALVLLTAGALGTNGAPCSPSPEALVALASAVEMLHAASLVHDDIIDNADSRRHQVSLNRMFGNRVAVLAGDILYTHFFSVVLRLGGIEPAKRIALLDIFLATTKAMCTGEILAQEVATAKRALTLQEYLEIITDKTAVLFASCFRTAAVLCDVSAQKLACLEDIGLNFGLVFQMADDIVDKDHGLPDSVDLVATTQAYAEKTRRGIDTLSPGPHRDSLRDLLDYVITSAIP
ncbi:MAG TPA: polyprenyl synthetase family protein [Spirochaetia bacterium]